MKKKVFIILVLMLMLGTSISSYNKIIGNEEFDTPKNGSTIVLLTVGEIEFLFTGDLEHKGELKLLDKFRDIDILKAGDHGSKTSSSMEFLNVVRPETVIISAGENNSHGYPHAEALARLGNFTEDIYGTWQSGDIIITTDGVTYEINTEDIISIGKSEENLED